MTVDLKTTTADLDSRSLSREIAKYRYHIQEAFYRRAYYRCHGEWPVFVFVFVSTKPPYLVRCVELDDATRDAGACAVDKALTIWHACQMTGTWPGYDDVEMISLPPWELNQ
jgi:exodeoxyribonuclease VIII